MDEAKAINEEIIIVTDKLNLTFLQSKGVYPISPPSRVNGQVQFAYKNNKEFQNTQLEFMKDENFKNYKMAEKTIEQLLRTTR